MKLFLMQPLHWNKQIILLFIFTILGCKSSLQEESLPQPYLHKEGSSLIYDASIDYKDFHASGLLVIKKLEGTNYHLVLLSKFGVSLMEFQLKEDGIKWIKSFDQLKDKKSAENLIEKDFRILLLTALVNPSKAWLRKEKDEYDIIRVKDDLKLDIHVNENNKVVYAENRGIFNPVKTKVAYSYDGGDIPRIITLEHRNIKMKIDLKLLKTEHAQE